MKSRTDFELGQIVISSAGRDKGRRLIVIGIENEEYVLVADGMLRKVQQPKKKKGKHLKKTLASSEAVREALDLNEQLTNELIRNEILKAIKGGY